MVDFNAMEEMQIGAEVKTKITEIKEGTQNDFRAVKYWDSLLEKGEKKEQVELLKNQKCVEIITDNGAKMVINLPANNIIHPKSLLAKFKKTYNSFPKVDLIVKSETDENGFNRIVLKN